MLILVLTFLFSYLVGAIPTGYWFAKYCFGIDVTVSGSGNIGATNVARVLSSKKYFFLIFFLDFFKAFLALFLIKTFCVYSYLIFPKDYFELWLSLCAFDILVYSSIFLLIGNAYSIFLNFKGGKGVSTTLGILAFLGPLKLFLIFLFCWGLMLMIAKRVYIASLLSIYFTTIIYFFFFSIQKNYFTCDPKLAAIIETMAPMWRRIILLLFLCIWLTFRHRKNINSFFVK